MLSALRRVAPGGAVVRALLSDEDMAVCLLDKAGRVCGSSEAFRALAGDAPCFAGPAAAAVAMALRDGTRLSAAAEMTGPGGTVPVTIRLLPTGVRRPAAVLRVTDLRPARAAEARLAQAQRLRAVGELAAGIAHDFNNLLTAILCAANAVSPYVEGEARQDLGHIHSAVERGAGLVRQLLAFSRQQTLRPQRVALNDAVRGTAGLLRRLLGAGITIDLALEEPGRTICVDPGQLDQVLVNLAVNARDAMKNGGTLTLATGHRLVLSAVEEGGETLQPGRYAVLDVRDTGGGIAPDVLPRIFEPFFTTRRDAGGTGLGLATVQGIVRQSGGHLSVHSVPGEGTCFRIMFPRHETALAPAPPLTPAVPLPSRRPVARRLLLVDDEATVRRLAARALQRAGWEVIEAGDGAEALAEAPENLSLVVSDVIMPGLDGPALVRALREAQPGLPAILMSGYADSAQRAALAAQDIAFLAKPFGVPELVGLAEAQIGPEAASTKGEGEKSRPAETLFSG